MAVFYNSVFLDSGLREHFWLTALYFLSVDTTALVYLSKYSCGLFAHST